jgi:hypothetical protein
MAPVIDEGDAVGDWYMVTVGKSAKVPAGSMVPFPR